MKKRILTLIILGAIICQGFAQSKIMLPSSQYDLMKKNGQLKPDVQYIPIANEHPMTAPPIKDVQTSVITEKKSSGNTRGVAAQNCSCLIQNVDTDPTFTIAEIVQGTANPPDYRNDDGSTALKTIPFNFCLYGTSYNSLYINNNGNVTFDMAYGTFTATGFPSPSYVMVAPFWADVDTRNLGSGLVYYKITPTYMIVQWKRVGYYNQYIDKLNTFQLIITDGTDPILPNGNNIAFCYGDMQWTTGDASQGTNGFGGVAATVGVNKGDGTNYFQVGRFDQPGIAYDGSYGNNDGVDWLDNQSIYFNSCNATNIAPIASGLSSCDTIKVCGVGDTLILNGYFLAPEPGQNTSIAVNLNGMANTSILSNTPGNSADAIVQIIASAANGGNHTITFTATDNGNPVGVTTVNVTVFIDTTGLSNFNPHISGNLEFCQGGTTTLSVTPTNYSYVWNTGSFNTSIPVDTGGIYWVTSTFNGCHKSSIVRVTEHPSPTPVIDGYPFTCPSTGNITHLFSDSLIYNTYSWNTGSTNDSVTVGNGFYTLTVTDAFGCTGTSPQVQVTGAAPPVITGNLAVCNGTLATLYTTFDYVSYNWTNNGNPIGTTDTVHVPAGGPFVVTAVDVNNCTVTSAPLTVPPFNYSLAVTGLQHYCQGNSITLTAAGTPAANASYLWTPNNTNLATLSVNTGGNVTCTLTYPNGCTTDTVINVFQPYPLPTPVIQGPTFTCGTTPAVLSLNQPYVNYLWTNTSPPNNTNSSISVLTGAYTVTVTDNHNCVGTSNTVNITNQNPTVAINGNMPFCPGSSITLTAQPSIPAGVQYHWSNTETTNSINVNSGGNYSVYITYAGSPCSDTNAVTVTPYAAASAHFVANPPSPSGSNSPISFIDQSTPTGAITNWLWNFGDGASSSSILQNPIHTYTADGTYAVTLFVQTGNGCSDSIRLDYQVVSEIVVPNVFTPGNPGANGVNQYFYVKNLELYPGTKVTVYNRWGRKVFESSDYHNDWNGGKEADGVYFYELTGPLIKESKYGFVEIIK